MLQRETITEIDADLEMLRAERSDFNDRLRIVNGWGAVSLALLIGMGWVVAGIWLGYQFGSVFGSFMIPLCVTLGTAGSLYFGLQILRFVARIFDEWESASRIILDDAERDLMARRAKVLETQPAV